jgi:hypothetical protein
MAGKLTFLYGKAGIMESGLTASAARNDGGEFSTI